jgi:hypothetical protein
MRDKKKWLFVGVLVLLVLFIKWFTGNTDRVEAGYATGFYPPLARVLRIVFGWLPFSIGDIMYGLVTAWCLIKLTKGIKTLLKKQATWRGTGKKMAKAVIALLLVYVVFYGFWGINYNRQGIASQLGLTMEKYTAEELININALLVEKTNAAKQALIQSGAAPLTSQQLFLKAQQQYEAADSLYSFLQYKNKSIKASLWGWLGNYVGFLGYYNPFTGEAQVNTMVPKFLQPFTVCHEVAHQLGYAKENEANFVGYLAASNSDDKHFQYSVYLDLFLYSNRNLAGTDTVNAKKFAAELLPAVKNDLNEWRVFNRRHKNPVEPVIRWLYGKYLQRNEQPQGLLSYDAVTSFIIAYYKKFGKI